MNNFNINVACFIGYFLTITTSVADRSYGRNQSPDANQSQKGSIKSRGITDCNWNFGSCKINGNSTCGIGKKLGRSINDNCPLKEKLFKCKISCGCEYKVMPHTVSECDETLNRRSVTHELTRGNVSKCALIKVTYRNCNKGLLPLIKAMSTSTSQMENDKRRSHECKYRKSSKGICDIKTNRKTITYVLKDGQKETCEKVKVTTKPCRVRY